MINALQKKGPAANLLTWPVLDPHLKDGWPFGNHLLFPLQTPRIDAVQNQHRPKEAHSSSSGLLSSDRVSALQVSIVPTMPHNLLTLNSVSIYLLHHFCDFFLFYDRKGCLCTHVFSNTNEIQTKNEKWWNVYFFVGLKK